MPFKTVESIALVILNRLGLGPRPRLHDITCAGPDRGLAEIPALMHFRMDFMSENHLIGLGSVNLGPRP